MKAHNNELQIDEDIHLERKTWTFQRVSWVVMLLIVLAALLGFTGRGGLPGINEKKISTNTMVVNYDRFLRNEFPEELNIDLQNLTTTTTAITFSKAFYEDIEVEQVVPEPETVQVGAQGIIYTFSTPQTQSHITFYTKPTKTGPIEIIVTDPGNESVTMSQFVYP